MPETFAERLFPRGEGLRIQANRFMSPIRGLKLITIPYGASDFDQFIRLGGFGDPASGKLHYPISKKRK